ncbi:MAG TPA: hypothetical protein VIX19_14350 [Terriglobales bacterium]
MNKPRKLPRGIFVRDGEYWINYRDQLGRRHREHVGPFLEFAKRALEKRHTERAEGKFFPERMGKVHPVLFGEIAKAYLKLAKGRKRSWRDAEDHLQALECLNNVPISELTAGRLESVLNELAEEREWKPATFNRHRSTISGVFEYGIQVGKVQMNPARVFKKRREENC